MPNTTLFTWGYHGWGNATSRLVEIVDAAERGRGFQPPLFVDIRIRRTVRAPGFQGNAFEKLIGPDRYRWMKSLGNRYIETRRGPTIQIAEPEAAAELLELAVEQAEQGRRILFFCSCQYPMNDGETACHRETVASFVLKAAKKARRPVEVIEWPGGKPGRAELNVSPQTFEALERGRVTIPLQHGLGSPDLRCLPWASTLTVRATGKEMRVITGPASWHRGNWLLPVFWFFYDARAAASKIDRKAIELRKAAGLDARCV